MIAILLCFALLGAADKILGGKLGVAQEFDRGLAAMGPLCVSMAGIYCVAVYALSSASKDIAALTRGLPFDPSLLLSMLLATDMGGWAAAKELAATPELAVYSGLLVASTMGCLISFTLPVSLGGLARHEVMGFMQGVVWGIVALPAGLLLGAVVCGLSAAQTLWNVLPVLVLCVLVIAALKFAPRGCIVFFDDIRADGARGWHPFVLRDDSGAVSSCLCNFAAGHCAGGAAGDFKNHGGGVRCNGGKRPFNGEGGALFGAIFPDVGRKRICGAGAFGEFGIKRFDAAALQPHGRARQGDERGVLCVRRVYHRRAAGVCFGRCTRRGGLIFCL